jgi:hypothetical protein
MKNILILLFCLLAGIAPAQSSYSAAMKIDTQSVAPSVDRVMISGCACATPCGGITTYLGLPASWAAESPHYGETPVIAANTLSPIECFTFTANNTSENINMGSVVTGHACGFSQFNWTVYTYPGCAVVATGTISNLTVSGLTCGSQYVLCVSFKNSCQVDSICPYVYNSACSPLPIQLAQFTCQYDDGEVFVNWVVATQLNNKEFIIEKTTDGNDYTEVATVPGAGTYPFTMSYSAVDYTPTVGTSYYRLRQIDVDGHETPFPPVAIFVGTQATNSLSMYPNLVTSNAVLVYTSDNAYPLSVSILDVVGRRVESFDLASVAGQNTFIINISSLSPGLYFLNAVGMNRTYTLKFIKH